MTLRYNSASEELIMNLSSKLIAQCKNPHGFTGKIMLRIMNSTHSQIMNWGLSQITIADDSIVLDIGCGGGKTLKLLTRYTHKGTIYGVDYSEEAVKLTMLENQEAVHSGRMIVKQGSVSDLPFAEDTFDIITAFQTHYFWPDLENDLAEVKRVLKPNGQFVLAAELYKIKYHMQEYNTTESMHKLLMARGFQNVYVCLTKKHVCFVAIKS